MGKKKKVVKKVVERPKTQHKNQTAHIPGPRRKPKFEQQYRAKDEAVGTAPAVAKAKSAGPRGKWEDPLKYGEVDK